MIPFKNNSVFLILFSMLFLNASATDFRNFYVSSPENTNTHRNLILIGDQITFNNDEIIINISDNRTIVNRKKGKIVLKATNKIVFKPGTKIKAGETLHASIISTNIQEERLLEKIKYELSCLFNETENEKDSFKNDNDKQIGVYSISRVEGVIENQQRRTVTLKSTNHQFAAIYIKSKDNLLQTNSSFTPETVKVLRL